MENDKDGSHSIEIDANQQVVRAQGSDSFSNYGADTRFVFHHGVGEETIIGFRAAGRGHDMISLPQSDASRLGHILASAHGDGQGNTTINLGQGDAITFVDTTVAALKDHPGDFTFHA